MKRWGATFLLVMSVSARLDAGMDAPVVESPEVLQKQAAFGDATAQYKLARQGLAAQAGADRSKAVEWLRKAAAAGLSSAQFDLGAVLANGKEAPQNNKEALQWFGAAARNGVFEAQLMMIEFLGSGRGVERNPAAALWWDMVARRTLELRTGVSAGLPPKPAKLRADGAAEVADKDGGKYWILGDGSTETLDADGVRRIEHRGGAKSTVQRDGSWETVFPNGWREAGSVTGRRTFTDDKGNQQIYEPDGTSIVESDAQTDKGQKVRVRDTFGLDGKRISHRVKSDESTYEERADGSKFVETPVKSTEGVAMILKEQIDSAGRLFNGRLRRADTGAEPEGSQVWTITRKIHLAQEMTAFVKERYSESGLVSQEVLGQVRETEVVRRSSVASTTVVGGGSVTVTGARTVGMSAPTFVSVPGGGSRDDPKAFAPKPDLAPDLEKLRQVERDARMFAGASDADYQRAQTASVNYYIPLNAYPQRKTAAPGWLRESGISKTTLHEEQLVPIADDRSGRVPFGPFGADAMKLPGWKHAETQHFIVHFMNEPEARLTVQYIEGVVTVLGQLLNLDTVAVTAKSHVFLFPDGEWKDFRHRHDLPDQVAGFAYRTELLLGANGSRQERPEVTKVICHEATHALVARYYPGVRAPLWLNEGLAEYIAVRTLRAKTAGATKSREESRPSASSAHQIDVSRLFGRLHYGEGTSPDLLSAFYGDSQKAVQVLIEKLPLENFPQFFNLIIAGNEPGVSLATAYGKRCDGVAAFGTLLNAP